MLSQRLACAIFGGSRAAALIYVKQGVRTLPSLARLNREAIALFSGDGPASAALRLHRTVPAVKGGAVTVRSAVGSRGQARRLPADGAPGWLARSLLHTQRHDWADRFPAIVDHLVQRKATSGPPARRDRWLSRSCTSDNPAMSET
jgi:hypothetical protein